MSAHCLSKPTFGCIQFPVICSGLPETAPPERIVLEFGTLGSIDQNGPGQLLLYWAPSHRRRSEALCANGMFPAGGVPVSPGRVHVTASANQSHTATAFDGVLKLIGSLVSMAAAI